ncbi:MAG TPA: hypothetical protein VGI92_04490 [Gemmatimonadales bacterium]|jgi:hypothetical protein
MDRLAAALLGAGMCATVALPRPAAAQKLLLKLRPPNGEAIKYRDHFESWISIGSEVAHEPALEIEIWRTETATARHDTTTFISIVDSAHAVARWEGAPPEFGQQAQMMRGTRETTLLTAQGREISYSVRGVSIDDVWAMLFGGRAGKQQTVREWRTVPEDSVSRGDTWDDSLHIQADSLTWLGRVQYRLRGIEQKHGEFVGRVSGSGSIAAPGHPPVHLSSETVVDAESGRLVSAQVSQEGGIGKEISIDIRDRWRTDRIQ